MPPAICDSEDEDEILVDDGPSQRSTFSAHAAQAEALLEGFPSYDGANDEQPASTTSSELRRQIQSAERNLVTTASLSTPAISTSPVLQRDNRRRSTVVGSEPVASPPKSVRRTKTANLKTYGSSNRAFQAADDTAFAALRDDAGASKTSQSARFSEHSSGPNMSSGLPAGTIQEDFMNHEPNVMFKDTGSTNAFNESSQQRLVEQALNNGKSEVAVSQEKATASSGKQQSSSFPWSASADPTQTPKNDQPVAGAQDGPEPDAAKDTIAVASKQPSASLSNEVASDSAEASNEHPTETNARNASKTSDHAPQISSKARAPKSSPVVEIPRYQPSQEEDDDEPPKASRGRKRKAQAEPQEPGEPPNSDDKAIGLPKENYKPRPSRRRATAAVEEPIDYSVVPEKAAKKRRKTAEGKIDSADHQPDKAGATDQTSTLAASTQSTTDAEEPSKGTGKKSNDEKQSKPKPTEPVPSPPQQSDAPQIPASAKKAADAMLMKPPALPASASKRVRRSKTTIFEDHIELNRSQKSPTLSQLQANRKAALSEVSNESKPSKRQKRRTVVDDEEDDEDELAKDMSEEEEEAPPKKRGRPAKPKPQAKSKSKEKVFEDSEAEDDELELEEEEPPRKKGPGRPRKSNANNAAKQKDTAAPAQETPSEQPAEPTSENLGQSSPSKAALERKDANSKVQSNAKDASSPSLEKPGQPPTKDVSSAKPSPTTTHSPIKGSSFANYRVGLSKRSRIPSLLKSFRAPAPARR